MDLQQLESTENVIEKMWQRSPFLFFVILLMMIPLLCSFAFGFYVMQTYINSMNKLSDNVVYLKSELEKQTTILSDIKSGIYKIEIENTMKKRLSDNNNQAIKKPQLKKS